MFGMICCTLLLLKCFVLFFSDSKATTRGQSTKCTMLRLSHWHVAGFVHCPVYKCVVLGLGKRHRQVGVWILVENSKGGR